MRRKALAVLMLLGLLAGACGGGSESNDSAWSQTTSQPDLNAEVWVAANEDQWTEGGSGAKSYQFMYVYNVQVYEPPIYLGTDYTLKPGLAERRELQPDGITWRSLNRHGIRARRNWALADQLRSELRSLGVELYDGKDGTRWYLTSDAPGSAG